LKKRLWDEYQEVLKIHGIHSSKTEEKFKELFKQIDRLSTTHTFNLAHEYPIEHNLMTL